MELEYFHVEDDIVLVAASDEEMEAAKSIAEDVGAIVQGALEGGQISTNDILVLKLRIWFRKWEVSMIFTAVILVLASFIIGRKTAKNSENKT